MHRKVIQVAGNVLMVSIPAEFKKCYDIRKGDELDVNVIDGQMVVSLSSEIIERNKKSSEVEIPFD